MRRSQPPVSASDDVPSNDAAYAALPAHLDRRLLTIASVVVIGSFMSTLDTTIVNVAINDLGAEFGASIATIQWVATGYLLALAMVIPLSGWFADRFGTKRLYMTSLVLFAAGSLLSGIAWSAESLILFRVLQGFGGGMIMPTGMTILTQAAGPKRMGRMMGVIGVPMLLGPVVGPVLGGWLVDAVSWRWIFFVNLPVAAVALVMATRLLPSDAPTSRRPLDVVGLLTLSPGVAIFLYGLAETASVGGFGSLRTAGPAIAGLGLVIAFFVHARRRGAEALIDLQLFSRFPVAPAAATTFLFGIAFFGVTFVLPLWLQLVRGSSPLETGMLLTPQGLGAMVSMPLAGHLTDRIGPRPIILVGLPLTIGSLAGFALMLESSPLGVVLGLLFVSGLGMGATLMPALSAAMRSLRHDEIARTTSGMNVVQRVGGSLGIAVLAVVLSRAIDARLPDAGVSSGERGLAAVQQAGTATRPELVAGLESAFHQPFLWAAVICTLALIPAVRLPRERPKEAVAGSVASAEPKALVVD